MFVDTFGESVTFTPASGGASSLSVIFRSRPENGLDVVQPGPIIHFKESDDPGVAQGDGFIVSSVDYTVQSVEKDGFGMVIAVLQRTT